MLELEVAEWKNAAAINQNLLIMERVSTEYGKSEEFKKVKNDKRTTDRTISQS